MPLRRCLMLLTTPHVAYAMLFVYLHGYYAPDITPYAHDVAVDICHRYILLMLLSQFDVAER